MNHRIISMGMGNVCMQSRNGSRLGYEIPANDACCRAYAVLSAFTRCLAIYQGNIHKNGYAFSGKTCAITLKIAKKL